MSAPLIWIIVPLAASILLWFFQEKQNLTLSMAVLLCLVLALTAVFQPLGSVLKLGPLSVEINTTLSIFGRSFILENADRFFLAFIYFAAVFWFIGSRLASVPAKFIPLSLAIISLLTAGLAVDPFLYAAVLIELAIIVMVPLLVTKGKRIGKGVLRFLIYQSLAMPFILFAGWILSGTQANPSDATQLNIAALFLGLGFAFWLAVFPFHVWMPQLSSETHPYIAGFVLSILPTVFLLIMLNFLDGLVWLKDAAFLPPVLKIVGVIMVVTGGLWAASQTDLRRLFGFAVIIESGFALLSISLRNSLGSELFYLSFIPRTLGLGVWALALSILQKHGIEPDLDNLKGQIRKFPVISLALLCAVLSSAGLPLLAGFPFRLELLEQFSTTPVIVIWLLIGMAAFMFAACRLLAALIGNVGFKWSFNETPAQIIFLAAGAFFLILIGIIPSVFIGAAWKSFAGLLALN